MIFIRCDVIIFVVAMVLGRCASIGAVVFPKNKASLKKALFVRAEIFNSKEWPCVRCFQMSPFESLATRATIKNSVDTAVCISPSQCGATAERRIRDRDVPGSKDCVI